MDKLQSKVLDELVDFMDHRMGDRVAARGEKGRAPKVAECEGHLQTAGNERLSAGGADDDMDADNRGDENAVALEAGAQDEMDDLIADPGRMSEEERGKLKDLYSKMGV